MNRSFTKLFSSIVTSTIWREDDKTRLTWITLLALADQHGEVAGSVPGLAAMANITVDECDRALHKLMTPDAYSRTKDHEGRRIEVIEGGWRLLNYQRYRELGQSVDRREYLRVKQREHRARQQQSTPVNSRQQASTNDTHVNNKQKEKQSAEEKKKREEGTASRSRAPSSESAKRFRRPTAAEVSEYAQSIGYALDGQRFIDHYTANGWRVGRNPMKDWQATVRGWRSRDARPDEQPTETAEQTLARLKSKGLM